MRNTYNQTFKDEAVALALGGDEPVSKIALDLGLNQQTLGNWVRKAMNESQSKPISKPGKQDYQTLERELRRARKELALKEKEIIVLKKATAYFAKDHV
jgi:transposase